ncbi:MAG: PilN domain-containing protein [Nitrospirota bacterium]
MVRINLIVPYRKKRKPRIIPGPIILLVATAVVSLGAAGFFWVSLENKIKTLSDEKSIAERRLVELKKKIKEVDNYEKLNKTIEERVNVIEKLGKEQNVPLYLLGEINRYIPERVWLSKIKSEDEWFYVEGKSFTNSDISTFVENLRKSPYLMDIDVESSVQTHLLGKIIVYDFRIACKVKV